MGRGGWSWKSPANRSIERSEENAGTAAAFWALMHRQQLDSQGKCRSAMDTSPFDLVSPPYRRSPAGKWNCSNWLSGLGNADRKQRSSLSVFAGPREFFSELGEVEMSRDGHLPEAKGMPHTKVSKSSPKATAEQREMR
jgi:hypothetical protein